MAVPPTGGLLPNKTKSAFERLHPVGSLSHRLPLRAEIGGAASITDSRPRRRQWPTPASRQRLRRSATRRLSATAAQRTPHHHRIPAGQHPQQDRRRPRQGPRRPSPSSAPPSDASRTRPTPTLQRRPALIVELGALPNRLSAIPTTRRQARRSARATARRDRPAGPTRSARALRGLPRPAGEQFPARIPVRRHWGS